MKEFQKQIPAFKDNFISNKFQKTRHSLKNENIKLSEPIQKNNLPELKLTKIKLRPISDPELDKTKEKLKINNKTGLKYIPYIPNKNKEKILIKKNELMFPKIKKTIHQINNNNFLEQKEKEKENNNNNNNINIQNIQKNNKIKKFSSKRKTIYHKRNEKLKTLYGTYGINSKNINNINNIININSIPNKNNDNEKNNIENNINTNNNNKIKSKFLKNNQSNKSLPHKAHKSKKNKKELNLKEAFIIQPLITNNIEYNSKNNEINNKEEKNNEINLKENKIKNNPLENKDNNINNNININIPLNIENKQNILDSFKPTPFSLPTTNNFIESEILQRLNIINSLLNPLNFFSGFNLEKTVELSSEIFNNNYINFEPSIISNSSEFINENFIKGYAYNSSKGKYRDYNEDTITATKILFNTFFFAIYDGHGGNGCSSYLKESLHLYIKNFSKESLNEAINSVENNFIKEKALDEKGNMLDHSGSCGIMALIHKNKLIIANIGDSRLILFKKSCLFFQTEDHKPDSPKEKLRIENNGGKIYRTQSLIPLYQNGKKIEIPWRVFPGRLSVSRTFGDVEAKIENLGGNKDVVVAKPDITEIDLDDDFNFLVIGCDGIFDVLSNEQILECVKIVFKEKKIDNKNNNINNINISELCGDIADMIIKSSLALDSFDNISCIVVAFNMKDLII